MALSTPIAALPYPQGTDTLDGPGAFLALSTALDQLVTPKFASAAARDAAIPGPQDGMRVYRTDLHNFEHYSASGSAWTGERGLAFAEGVLAAPAATIAFTSIPQNANHLRLYYSGRSTAAGTSVSAVTLTFSGAGSVAGLYETSAPGSTTWTGTSSGSVCGLLPNAGTASTETGLFVVDIPFYTSASGKLFLAAGASTSTEAFRSSIYANSSTAISSITLTGTFATGTKYGLYGAY